MTPRPLLTPYEHRVLECVKQLKAWHTSFDIHFIMDGQPSKRLDTISALKHLTEAGYIERKWDADSRITMYRRITKEK